jgi:hypothetical protein
VFWLIVPPGHGTPIPGKNPEEMIGDTKIIKVSAAFLGPQPNNPTPTVSRFAASWKPAVHGLKLKLCSARLTFTWRKPLVSHQWHPHPLTILFNPEANDLIKSFVVTAAR